MTVLGRAFDEDVKLAYCVFLLASSAVLRLNMRGWRSYA